MNFFIPNRGIIKKGNTGSIRENRREHAGDNLRFRMYNITSRDAFSRHFRLLILLSIK